MDLLPLLNFTGGFLSLKFEERTEDQWKQWKWSKTSETFVKCSGKLKNYTNAASEKKMLLLKYKCL